MNSERMAGRGCAQKPMKRSRLGWRSLASTPTSRSIVRRVPASSLSSTFTATTVPCALAGRSAAFRVGIHGT